MAAERENSALRPAVAGVLSVILVVAVGSITGQVLAGDPAGLSVATAAPSGVAAGPSGVTAGPSGVAVGRQYDTAFGYRVGEERRYVLEPERSLRAGDSAWWSIVLARVEGEGDSLRAVFDLQHQRTELIRDIFGGSAGRTQVVEVNSRLTVNRFGFPERLVIDEQSDVGGEMGSLSELRTTVFRFDAEGERFVKEVRIDGREWDFNIAIASHDSLDLSVPAGLFAYLPTALRCLGVPGEVGRPFRCEGGDPAFANPGLLSLALPLLWEEQVNQREFMFFKPNGVGTLPGGLMDMNRLMQRERDHLANYNRYFDRMGLEVKEFVTGAEIGPRSIDAWLFDGSGEMREVWAQRDGTVLKVNIDPHPVTRAVRWIRLQFPSEY